MEALLEEIRLFGGSAKRKEKANWPELFLAGFRKLKEKKKRRRRRADVRMEFFLRDEVFLGAGSDSCARLLCVLVTWDCCQLTNDLARICAF